MLHVWRQKPSDRPLLDLGPTLECRIDGKSTSTQKTLLHGPLTRYAKLRVAHAPGMPETISSPPLVSDPDMHHGTCLTHVAWCMSGSLTSGFLWNRWRGKRSRHFRRMRNPQFCVSGKRPIGPYATSLNNKTQHHESKDNVYKDGKKRFHGHRFFPTPITRRGTHGVPQSDDMWLWIFFWLGVNYHHQRNLYRIACTQ